MMRKLLAALALCVAGPAIAQPAPAFQSFTAEFDRFALETAAMPEAERVKRFRARFNALVPGFYEPRNGLDDARYDARVARALNEYPAIRDKYLAAAAAFDRAYASGTAHFRQFFPDFRPNVPIYLVHSLGEMDGGGRTLRGKDVMVFGADVIARVHSDATVGPFFDHELFHIYHGQYFQDCGKLWCSLWIEGLAVYAAARMNPTTDDAGLLLTQPRPIRPEVEPRLAEAFCLVRDKFDSAEQADLQTFFMGGARPGPFPPRFGYYIGYELARAVGKTYDLSALARMSPAQAQPLLQAAVTAACNRTGN